MNLRKLIIFTKNACYKAGRKIKPRELWFTQLEQTIQTLEVCWSDDGLLGTNQYNNHWNQDRPDGRQVCVHAFIGKKLKDGVYCHLSNPALGS